MCLNLLVKLSKNTIEMVMSKEMLRNIWNRTIVIIISLISTSSKLFSITAVNDIQINVDFDYIYSKLLNIKFKTNDLQINFLHNNLR